MQDLERFEFGAPLDLMSLEGVDAYDISPDGNRFYLLKVIGQQAPPAFSIIQNWMAALPK